MQLVCSIGWWVVLPSKSDAECSSSTDRSTFLWPGTTGCWLRWYPTLRLSSRLGKMIEHYTHTHTHTHARTHTRRTHAHAHIHTHTHTHTQTHTYIHTNEKQQGIVATAKSPNRMDIHMWLCVSIRPALKTTDTNMRLGKIFKMVWEKSVSIMII